MRNKLRRPLAFLLSAVMIVTMSGTPVHAVADRGQPETGLCEHHAAHTDDCGYTEETPGTPCGHEHTEDCYTEVTECVHEHTPECYPEETEDSVSDNEATPANAEEREPENCPHICDGESGCITEKLDCRHEHDSECGYTESTPGTPCTYVCEICNPQDSGEADEEPETGIIKQEQCSCLTLCTEGQINPDCPVCGAEDAGLSDCKGKAEKEDTKQPEDTGICKHHQEHDDACGYQPESEDSEGSPCTYECRICPIEDLIAALPDEVTADNAEEVRAWLDEILALFGALTGDEQELVDITPCLTLQEQLDAASAASPLADTITLNSRITINSGNLNQYNNKVITGATTKDHLTISGVTINLTIKDLSIQLPYSGDVNSGLVHAGIKLENNATLNLTLEGTNTIKGGSMNAAINVPAGCTLTISGSGSLTARGGDGSAGIGANFGRQSGIMTVGTININGGTIDAYGSSGGAGIGGTLRGSTGRVVINGGTVYAEGSGYSANMGTALSAAGIGGGSMGKLESITITGGTVTARGHKVSDAGNTSASAGIGAGTGAYAYDDGVRDCGDITITGGTIDAKGGGDYAIGFGANSGNQTGGSIQVSGSPSINMNGGKMKPVPGDYILCELKVTIYDRSIVSDQSATLSYGCASWTGTLKKSNSEPYCGTLTASNLLVKGSGSPTLTVEAGGKTWTKEVSPQPNCSVIIGNQDYQKYSLTGTIYDGRITGAMTAASVTINGETHQVTLTRKDCQVSFSLPNLGAANASGAFPVTVTAGGITWTGTTSGGSNKTLTIGTRLQKVRLNFWDSAINRNISVQAQVSRRGSPLGASETVNDGTLHRTQNGNGYLEIWMVPGEDTTISVTVPGLNGGQAIEKTGLTIEARDMELDWYRGVSSDTPALDLSKGPITFDGSRGSLSVTYSDGTGKQHTQSNLSYDALHVITQSDSAATGNYIVVKNLTQQLHIQVNGIHIDRNTDKDPSINVEANCTVELQTEGENTVAGKLHHAPVSVDPSATLILGGTGTLTVENRLERLAMSGAAIGGKSKQDSGKIIIESGTVVATSRGGGAAIGGGDTKKGTVEIRGGTVKATANKYGAAIGGGYQGAGTVKISGGQVNATVSGDASAIGGGTNGNGTVEISGGIVKATANGNGAAIGGGSRGAGTVEISGGRVEVTAKSGAAIGGGYQGAGTVKISGGQVNATVSGYASAIGGGSNGNGTVEISGGIVKATANENGAAIGGGDRGAGTVEISGGTITASSNRGDDVGNGASGSDGSVTITGGSIKTKKKQVLSPTNGSVDVSLVEITLPEGAVPADTAITSAEYYGVKDVYPLDGNKLYFYLPQDERPTIKVGDVDYVPDSPGSTNYIAALSVTLKDYPQSKAYDGNPVENPTTTQVSSSTAYDEMTFTWYQNGTLLSDKPVNAGSYALRVSNAQGIYRDFAVEVTKRPLTITAQAQTIDYGTEIAQDRYTASGLAAGDAVGSISLSADQTTTGTHSGAITISSAQIMRGGVDVTENYDITYEPGDLTINQIACTVSSWPTAAGITYGQALGDSALTGGDANGIFAWKDSTIKPNAGTAQFSVTFTPNDTNYNTATADVSVTIAKATPTLTAPTASAIEYGQKLSDSALTGGTASNPNGNAAVAGSWSWANGNTQPTATGTFPVAFVPIDTGNYNTPANVDTSVTVKPTEPKITLTATPAQQIAGGKVTVDCTVKNPHDAAFSDSLPDASLTYRIGSGAEQALTGDGFNIPAGTAVGTVITITASTAAVDGKYTAATRTATVTVTDKIPVEISGISVTGRVYNGQPVNYTGTPVVKELDGTVVTDALVSYTWSSVTAPVNAGDYSLVIAVDGGKYIGSTTIPVVIEQAEIRVTAPSKTIYVGETAPVFSAADCNITGLVQGENLKTPPTVAYAEAPDTSKTGSVTVTASGAKVPEGGNYKDQIVYENGTLTITSKPLPPAKYTVTVQAGTGGTASASPSSAEKGTKITLTAKPSTGYHFKEWQVISGGVTISGNSFTMPATNVTVKAVFEKDSDPPQATRYSVTVQAGTGGTASASLSSAEEGTKITLTAKPSTDYHFKEWQVISGGVTISNNSFTMPAANVTVKAVFEKDGSTPPQPTRYSVTVQAGTGGTASASPTSAEKGTKITLTATPDSGYHFKEWQVISGGVTISNNSFTMPDTNVTVKAVFVKNSNGGGNSGGSGSGGGSSSGGNGSSSGDNGSSGGGSTIVARPDETKPDTPTTSQTKPATPDKNGNVALDNGAVQSAINAAKNDAKKNGNTANGVAVVIPVSPQKGQTSFSVTIKAQTLDTLVREKVKRLEINIEGVIVEGMDAGLLKWLDTASANGDIILRVKQISQASLSKEAKAAIGTRPVYDLSLVYLAGGKETPITDFDGHTIAVRLPYAPAKEEQAGNLYAVYVDGKGKVEWLTRSSYDPDLGTVVFEAGHFSIYGIGYKNPAPDFTDIKNHWAEDNIIFVASRGLLTGTGNNQFSPNMGMTRGMFVTALGRLAGIDPDSYKTGKFTDVKADAYYAPYVNWAAEKGIVNGTTATTFSPDTNITREQMAVIMANYAKKLGYDLPVAHEAVTFADNAQISGWAAKEVKAMQQAGIMAGKGGNRFDPKGTATRAEVATVLRRFVEIVIDPQTAQGWVQNHSGSWQYMKNGKPATGWLQDDKKWYWLDSNGWMFTGGWKQIDGKWYYFHSDGSMAVNTTIDGYAIGSDGARK